MKKTTAGICLAALLVSGGMNSMLRADDRAGSTHVFAADETRHQWVNEAGGRTGMLMVRGALLSSPCTLATNTVELPLPPRKEGLMTRYVLTLDLRGCGDGGAVTAGTSAAGRDSTMVMQSALLTGVEGGVLQPRQRMISTGRAVLHGGANRFTYYLSEPQMRAVTEQQVSDRGQGKPYMNPRDNNALLRLRLDYE